MLNYIWFGLILLAVLIGGTTGKIQAVTQGAFDSAKFAVELAIFLIGTMALWLGIMRLADKAGAITALARGLRPLLRRLFPDVPPEHPAMGSMVMNMAANMLGLGNAATPLGLRAMTELEKLNPRPGTATNAMCTFLAINTSSVQLVPATAVALLAGAGSVRPSAIIGTALLATTCSSIAGIAAVKFLEKLPGYALPPAPTPPPQDTTQADSDDASAAVTEEPPSSLGAKGKLCLAILAGLFAWIFITLTFPKASDPGYVAPGEIAVTLSSGKTVRGKLIEESPTEIALAIDGTPANVAKVWATGINRQGLVLGESELTLSSGEKLTGRIESESDKELVLSLDNGKSRTIAKTGATKIIRPESAIARAVNAISALAIPLLLTFFPLYAMLRGVKVYEEFVEGAKEGFTVSIRIIPYLVAMLVAIGMFRSAGGVDLLTSALGPLLSAVGFPPELLPLSLMRPLSGSGSNAIFAELIKSFGPDSLITRTAGTILGSTETTFYVIALYFGSVAIKRTRHAIPAGLIADAVGIIASIAICRLAFA